MWSVLLKEKGNAFEKFKEFKKLIEKEFNIITRPGISNRAEISEPNRGFVNSVLFGLVR